MYYLNGVICGGDRSDSPNDGAYTTGRRQFRRMLWLWLTKVVGWTDVDKSGSNWDNPEIAGASDGTTDASDAEIFNSATGGFSALDLSSTSDYRYYATITGFTDSTKDGLYLIDSVVSDTQFKIKKAYCGVHSDGFPLSETGLTWRVDELRERSNKLPAIGDWWVLGGTGTGGTFHLRCVSDNSVSYSPDKYDISPYADWDAVGHAWESSPARYSAQAGTNIKDAWTDSVLVFGVADATHCVLWCVGYNYDLLTRAEEPFIYYFGDITPFRPTEDTRPVVAIAHECTTDEQEWYNSNFNTVKMVAGDNSQSSNAGYLYLSEHANENNWILDNLRKQRSVHSLRYYRLPIVIASYESGKEEIRGSLKSIEAFHRYGISGLAVPFGTGLDRLKLGWSCIPWHGSKQYRGIAT